MKFGWLFLLLPAIWLGCEEAEEAILEWIDRWEEAESEKDD